MLLPIPVMKDGEWDGITTQMIETTKNGYFNRISMLLKEASNDSSLLEVFQFLGVCPRGFVDDFTAGVVALESDAAAYHVLPSGGGIFDERAWLMDAFRAVRRARDDYYLWKYRKREKPDD
jgi:hypothetical protein